MVNFLILRGFFGLRYRATKARKPEMPKDTNRKILIKILLSLVRGLGKKKPDKAKTFIYDCSTPARQHRKEMVALST